MVLVDNGPFAIDAGRHPILESVHNDFVVGYTFVFSDIYLINSPLLSKNFGTSPVEYV